MQRRRARLLEHRREHVDAENMPGRANGLRREEAIEAGAAAKVSHCLALAKLSELDGVAAAETEIAARRLAQRQLVRLVPHILCGGAEVAAQYELGER